MFALYVHVFLFTTFGKIVLPSPVTVDKRQEGDLNVQVHLKDVEILAVVSSNLFEDYMNYDYAYDDADFTIKPPNSKPTTCKPNVTLANNSTTTTLKPLSENSTISSDNFTISSTNSTSVTGDALFDIVKLISNAVISETQKNATLAEGQNLNGNRTSQIFTGKNANSTGSNFPNILRGGKRQPKVCPAGFSPSKSGRCRRQRVSFFSLPMRLGPKLTGAVKSLSTL